MSSVRISVVLLLVSIICATASYSPVLGSEIDPDQLEIHYIKAQPFDQSGVHLFFSVKNNSPQDIDRASFDCNIFDRSDVFVEIKAMNINNLKKGDLEYTEIYTSNLSLSQFGRAQCRATIIFPR